MEEKRGAAHFEMIISFIFFATFVFFLFVVLNPYTDRTLPGAVIYGAYDSFEEMGYTNLTTFFLKADNNDINEDCFSIELPIDAFTYPVTNFDVKDVNGVLANYKLSGNILGIQNKSLVIYYNIQMSPEFVGPNYAGDCTLLSPRTIGSISEKRVVSYNKLNAISIRYKTDYEGLKRDLNIPEVFDFAIVSDKFPVFNMNMTIPDTAEVVANDYVLEVLQKTGAITNTRFTLKIW